MAPPDSYPIQRAEAESGSRASADRPGRRWPTTSTAGSARSVRCRSCPSPASSGSTTPRARCSGSSWPGRAASDLESVLRERVFEPLGMSDTGFTVPPEKAGPADHGLPARSRDRRADGPRRPDEQLVEHAALVPRRERLARLHHRRLLVVRLDASSPAGSDTGGRILSPDTVTLMTTDRLTPTQRTRLEALPRRARRLGPRTGGARCSGPQTNRCRAASAGTAGSAQPGAPTLARASPASSSPNARPRHRRLPPWSRTSGRRSTPPPRLRDPAAAVTRQGVAGRGTETPTDSG